MRRATIIGAISLFLWAGAAPDTAACSCLSPGPACFAANRADAVFVGRVTAFTSDVQFEVERAFKGIKLGQVTVENGPGNCAFQFTIGERYVVYAYRDRSTGALSTSMCTRTRALNDPHTRADIAYFTGQQRGASRRLLTGVVRDITTDLATPGRAGRPLAGIRITATPLEGGPRLTSTTRDDGSYELAGVQAGRLSIEASLPGQFEPAWLSECVFVRPSNP
jgi:hypothetical protein